MVERVRIFPWACRNLQRQGRRAWLSGVSIFLAFWALLMLSAFIGGVKGSIAETLRNFTSGDVMLTHPDYWQFKRFQPLSYSIPDYPQRMAELATLPEVAQVVPVIEVGAQGFKSVGGIVRNPITQPLGLRASDLQQEDTITGLSGYLKKGRLPQPGTRELLLSVTLAQQMELDLGGKITLILYNRRLNQTLVTFTVSGLFRLPGNALSSSALVQLDVCQRLLDLPEQVLSLHVLAANGVSREKLAQQLSPWLEGRVLTLINWEDVDALYQTMITNEGIFFLFRLIFVTLATTILLNTMTMAFFDRSVELATLETLGMRRADIRALLLTESAVLSLVAMLAAGVLSALLCGWAQAAGGVSLWSEDLSTSLGFPDKIPLPLQPLDYVSNGLVLLTVVQLAVLTPVWQLQKQPLVAGLRGLTPGQEQGRRKNKRFHRREA